MNTYTQSEHRVKMKAEIMVMQQNPKNPEDSSKSPDSREEPQPSGRLNHADTWISDFWPPGPWDNEFLLLSHPVYGVLLSQP